MAIGANEVLLCTKTTDKYVCIATENFTKLPELPANSCIKTDCHGCVVATSTFLVFEDELIAPTNFFDRPTPRKGNLSAFTCHLTSEARGDALTIPCDCSGDNCTGTTDFCSQFHCDPQAPCWCDITTSQYEFSHVSDDAVIVNPTFLSTQICLYRIPSPTKKFRRHLLENEAATFSQHNLTLFFNDPVVTVSETGTLIARISGNEIILQVSQDLSVVLPVEFTAYKDTLTLIFISASGKAVRGEVLLDGKSICRATHCVWCREFFAQLQCWPPYVMYILYTVLSFFILILLCFIRFAVTGIVSIVKLSFSIMFLLLKILKSFVRLFMLCGAVFGSGARTRLENLHAYLEEHNPHIRLRPALTMAVLCTLVSLASSICTSHSILKSDIKNCHFRGEEQHCEIFTTAELTLKGLDYEACIWFQDLEHNNLFNIKLKLVSAQCEFSSRRLYFTFPVRKRTITQLACPQNYYCAWGEHCIDNKEFAALTDESMDYPGFTGCEPSSVGSGCTIISRMGCLFYRVYFIPDLLRSYEVRSISGHQCTYTISLERVSNNTKEMLTFHSSAQTADGIQVDLLGAYNQAPLHFTDSLVLRVGHPTEAYLIPTSPPNRPIAGLVGQIQANVSFTKRFNFDKDMVRCDFFETTLRCAEVPDPLTRMFTSKDCALPSSRDLHLLTVDKGVLKSKLLSTAPVRLQLHFKNFKIHLQTTDICPKITNRAITTKGCYSCQILSEMHVEAFSSCQAGTVSIELQIIRLYTQTIILETEPKEFVIQFLADQKCYDEKICLVSRNMKNCQLISFCLNEPSINLLQLNTTYTKSFLTQDSSGSSFLEWFSMPTFTHIFFVLKLIGATLLLICLSLSIFSACLTCCKR